MRIVAPCCRAAPCEEIFKPRFARKTLRHYRKKGLGALERQMVSTISTTDLDGARVLEIGGGIGAIQAELLASGAREGEIVELLAAYEPYARELAREKGFETRSRFRVADVLEHPETVSAAGIVVLNRVVCCSPDGVRLTTLAAGLTERVLILSFPRDRLVVRAVTAAINGAQRLLGRSFRVFLHPRASLYAAAQRQGLEPSGGGRIFAWEFVAFRRAQTGRQ
jgi:magnesium-protoporphyrin O-methyltransferase